MSETGGLFRFWPTCHFWVRHERIKNTFTLNPIHSFIAGLAGLFFIVPESVRWLLANGKGAEAKEIIQEAARTNKVHDILFFGSDRS